MYRNGTPELAATSDGAVLTWVDATRGVDVSLTGTQAFDAIVSKDFTALPAAGATTPLPVSGTITSSSLLTLQTQKRLTGATTPVGVLTRQIAKLLSGGTTPAGALAKQTQKPLSGAITSLVGTETRQTQKPLAGTVTSAGTETRQTQKPLSGATTPVGVLARLIGKPLTGTITSAGVLTRQTQKLLTGTITSAGVLTRALIRALAVAGTVTSAGVLTRQTQKPLAGTVTSAGTETRQTQKRLTGTVTPAGALAAIRIILLALTGTITSAGAMIRSTLKPLSGSVGPAGALTRQTGKPVSGSVASAGTLAKQTQKPLTGQIHTGNADVVGVPGDFEAGLNGYAGSTSGGGSATVTQSSAQAFTGTFSAKLVGSCTTTSGLSSVRKTISGRLSPLTEYKVTAHVFIESISGPWASAFVNVVDGGNGVGQATHQSAINMNTVGSWQTITFIFQTGSNPDSAGPYVEPMRFTSTPGTAASVVAYADDFVMVSGVFGTLTRQTQKPLAGTVAPAGSLVKLIGKLFAGTLTSAGVLTRQTQKPLAGTVTPTGALATLRAVLINLAGTVTSAGALARQTQKPLSGALATAGAVTRSTLKRFTATITPTGAANVIRGSITLALSGTLAPVGTLTRRTSVTLSGLVTPAGALAKSVSKAFAGVLSLSGVASVITNIPNVYGTASGAVGLVYDAVATITNLGGGFGVTVTSAEGGVAGRDDATAGAATSDTTGSVI